MGAILNYRNWKKLYEAAFAFDPSGNYPDPTFGLPTGDVNSGKVSPGGAGGDWDGSMQRALAFGKIANEFIGKNVISSQKRKRVLTASNKTSDHFDGQDFTYAVDLACNLETGDKLLAYLMNWFGHPEYTGGTWFNVVKDGYRYQVGWRVKNHFDHIHVGVNKVDGKDSVSAVSTAAPTTSSPATTELNVEAQLNKIKSGSKLLRSGTRGEDVRAIQTKLKELGFFIKDPNGEYDKDTYNAVKELQKAKAIRVDGIVGPITYGAMYGVQISPEAITNTQTGTVLPVQSSGKIKHTYTGERASNIDLLIRTMEAHGITNPYSQAGILAVIGKETNYIPKNEVMNYSKERLPEVWGIFSKTGSKVPKGQGQANYNDLAVQYERNAEKLANFVYGQKPTGMRDNAYGNTQPGDGWKYRGRGFNQVTFKSGYDTLGKEIGMDLLTNPDIMNDPKIAADVAIRFFKNRFKEKGLDLNQFTDVDSALVMFARANAGWGSNPNSAIAAARQKAPAFTVA
jgi:putative chitinase